MKSRFLPPQVVQSSAKTNEQRRIETANPRMRAWTLAAAIRYASTDGPRPYAQGLPGGQAVASAVKANPARKSGGELSPDAITLFLCDAELEARPDLPHVRLELGNDRVLARFQIRPRRRRNHVRAQRTHVQLDHVT